VSTTFQLTIVTPSKTVFKGPVESVVAPGLEGYFGVLAHHAPLIAALGPGTLTVRAGRQETTYEVHEGFMEVSDNKAIVLIESLAGETEEE
jgi:F-type H+-transporting ATPase subunit epsilon